ncbi:uncharacterized protein LOC133800388 [Humulus lupulus]|uniref:uncharacterized protein LOC133800388 n=1 Tax=Humulus lupulus TaxID=3486 RepID=UPI002B405421|nr:uncharacterized protein LOC133800388 [Humulus lupulus]
MASSGDNSSPVGVTDPLPQATQFTQQVLVVQQWNRFSNSLSSSLTIKLDRANFLAWKSQVVPTVIGHDLDENFFSDISPPPKLVNGENNPVFFQWRHKDHLLLSWLRSSMTEGVLGTVSSYNSSYAMWKALEQKFSSQSKARLLQLKTIAGHSITDLDMILHLLNVLGPKFDSIVFGITSRSDTLSVTSRIS